MKILIAGAGRIGSAVAAALAVEGHDITIIEQSQEVVSSVSNALDVITIVGSAANPETLQDAGAADADLVIAATQYDEINMICGITAGKLGAKYVIARIRDPQYLASREFFHNSLGISMIINPEQACAAEISRILRFPGADQVDTFADGRVEMARVRIAEDSELAGLSLKDLPSRYRAKVLVCIAERDGKAIIPNGDFVITPNDRITIAGTPREMRRFFIPAGLYRRPIRSAMLMGGSRIALYLARNMLDNNIDVTILERDRNRCDELSEQVPGANIIWGDASRTDILLEEGLAETDAFLSLSGDDGSNIVASLSAKSCHVPKIITKINRTDLSEILAATGLEIIVNSRELVVEQITRCARAMMESVGSSMETLYRMADGKVEALEFLVNEDSRCADIRLRDLKLKPNVLICAINRGGDILIPGGNDRILPGDRVILVALTGRCSTLDDMMEN